MNHRIWMKIFAGCLLTLVIGTLAFFVTKKCGVDPRGIYRIRWVAKKLHIPLSRPDITPAQQAAARAEVAAWKAKFLVEFPALQISGHPVAAEENGFLQLYEIPNSFPISAEFEDLLSGIGDFDPAIAKRCLAEHAYVVAQIEKIGSLRTRSSIGMPDDYNGFIGARSAKQGADTLLLKARLAAEAGDENEALRCLTATGNIADHMGYIESPTLLTETVCLLLDLSMQEAAFTKLLPALGKSVDLTHWKSVLWRRDYSTTEYARVLRGEWDVGADFMAFPMLAISEKEGDLPDAEAVLHCHSSWTNDTIIKLPTLGLADLEHALAPPAMPGLSEEGREILDVLNVGMTAWARGYIRAAVVISQGRAAIELLILEKAGTQLAASDTGRITVDPLTGNPFVFDPATRELIVADRDDIDPLVLPW